VHPTRTIELPAEQAAQFEQQARAMRLDIPAYLRFPQECRDRNADPRFVEAAAKTLRDYSQTLRTLAA
jgi:hypothetical protein